MTKGKEVDGEVRRRERNKYREKDGEELKEMKQVITSKTKNHSSEPEKGDQKGGQRKFPQGKIAYYSLRADRK